MLAVHLRRTVCLCVRLRVSVCVCRCVAGGSVSGLCRSRPVINVPGRVGPKRYITNRRGGSVHGGVVGVRMEPERGERLQGVAGVGWGWGGRMRRRRGGGRGGSIGEEK